ncbi:hypothetical protein F4801DRAFT_600329 [Xylaria longipes]|nr:hypothetical protein F4801DRAFT_600329 [Xylaria longipes]RYC64403.1 hypothetical protein CHU98_g1804 [Xylaria longipes]
MAPKYQLYGGFAVKDALAMAGAPAYKCEFQEGEPPVAFFTEIPDNSAAVFSTLFGTRPFRLVENPTRDREGHYWWAAEIQRVCDELRRNLPDVCRKIVAPRSYWDLYKYFDAYDIYHRGAQNLWNVINTFVFENEYAQSIVENEQKMQAEEYIPLFEHLASELLRRPEIQTKLLTWDRERQQDILKLLTAYELQLFKDYEKYPDHFLDAIRAIFVRQYENLRKGPGSFVPCPAPIGGQTPNMAVSEHLASLRRYLQSIETLDDPFMDKFEIPNKIINGIVIVDGTSKTAARKAAYEGAHPSNNPARQKVIQDNGAHKPPLKWVPAEDVSSFSKESSGTTHHVSTSERCSSAPSVGGDPANILSNTVTKEARVYAGDGHEVDKKLMGCRKPTSPRDTGDDTPGAANALQISMPTPDGRLQQATTNRNQSLPNHYHHIPYQGSHRRSSPTRPPTLPPTPNYVPGPVHSHQIPGTRHRGISQGAFAHQIPPIHQHHIQGPPPTMQQMQHPHSAHVHSHAAPPYFQAEWRRQHDAPPAFTDGSEGFRQHKRNSSARNYSKGKWQQIGSDDIHGPKVVFRRGSVHNREDQNHRAGQWQSREYSESGRRTSTAGNNGDYGQFNNPHPQQYAIHTGLHQTNRDFATTGRNSRTSAASGHSRSELRCVNARKSINLFTKFDPCPCGRCSDRDRTIFVSRLKEGINQTEGALERLKQHFSKFGHVESVTPLCNNATCVHVKFAAAHTAVSAVRTEPEVQIDDLGDKPFKVEFRMGSQFFTPRDQWNFMYESDNRLRYGHNVQVIMPHPSTNGSNNLSVHVNTWRHSSLPEQQAISPSGAPLGGPAPGADLDDASKHAIDSTDQAATQSGREMEQTRRLSYSKMTSPVITPHPIHGLVVVDANDTRGMAKHQQKHSSRFERILCGGNIQESARNTADIAHDVTTSRQAFDHGTPNEPGQPDHSAPQTAIAPSNSQDRLAGVPENGDSAEQDEEASIDYGTVRIRPGKARYMAIPPAWRQESTPPHNEHATASQYLEITSQCGLTPITRANDQPIVPLTKNNQDTKTMEHQPEITKAPPQHDSGDNEMPGEDEHLNGHHDPCSHTKRKASETDVDEKVPDQPSPKKKFSKVIQPPDSLPGPQSSQPGRQQHKQRVGETGQTKAGKKKKKNKNRQNQVTQPELPKATSTAAPYEAPTFTIAVSHLPPYPQHRVQAGAAPHMHIPGPVYVRVPPIPPTPPRFANRLDGSEPFPAYRDLMSSPQLPLRGHRSHASGSGPNRSISSNASTIIHIHDYGPNNNRLNPGAQNFVPFPPSTSHRDSTLTFDPAMPNLQEGSHAFRSPGRSVWATQDIRTQEAPQPHMQTSIERFDSNVPALGQPAIQNPTPQSLTSKKAEENKRETDSSKGDHSKDETVPKAASKENKGSRANTGAKQGGGKGKGKSKNAKAGRNDQKNAIQPPVDRKGESTKPTGPKDSSPKKPKKVEVAVDQNAKVSKKDLPSDGTDKQHEVVEPQQNELLKQGGGEDIKTDQPEKEKGKEVNPPEKKPVAKGVDSTTATVTDAKTKKDQNDDKTPARPESRAGLSTAKTTETKTPPLTTTTGTPGPSTAEPTKPKQGKAKNRAPKKGVGTKQAPIARPSTSTNTGTGKSELTVENPDETKQQQAGSPSKRARNQQPKTEEATDDVSPSPEKKPRKKTLPALAPIPLCGPWRTVLGKKKTGTQALLGAKDAKDAKYAEKASPPDGERKGG